MNFLACLSFVQCVEKPNGEKKRAFRNLLLLQTQMVERMTACRGAKSTQKLDIL